MEKEYVVYCHINKLNQKKYIGISKNIKRRWENNGRQYLGFAFGNAILKYGWDNFEHVVLYSNLTKEEASKLEKELIAEYETTNPLYGYNIQAGGIGNTNTHPIYQYNYAGEFICKYDSINDISKAFNISNENLKGIYACCSGAVKSSMGYRWYWNFQGDQIESLEAPHVRTNNSKNKKVYQYSLDGSFVNAFESGKDAKSQTGISPYGCLRNKTSTAGGYYWTYTFYGSKIQSIIPPNEKTRNRLNKKVYVFNSEFILIKTYNSKKEAMKDVGLSQKKFDDILKNKKKFNEYYYSFSNLMD